MFYRITCYSISPKCCLGSSYIRLEIVPNPVLYYREQQGILASCNPIPPLVKQQLNEIHLIILKARDKPLNNTETGSRPETTISTLISRNVDLDDLIDCRHDRFPHDSDLNTQSLIDDLFG